MIYADSSALAKLVVNEPESTALARWLASRGVPATNQLVTNVIGVVELNRLARRMGGAAVGQTTELLARIERLELSATTVATASRVGPVQLRSLDALHVASAVELPELTAVVTYDQRMRDAAAGLGLPVVAPGAE